MVSLERSKVSGLTLRGQCHGDLGLSAGDNP